MDQIRLKNYRCFRDEQTVRLAPLTLLVGENSTGKTSFMAMVRALWDIAHTSRVPDFKEDPYDLGSFDEIAHHRGGRGGRADTFEAGFDFALEDRSSKGTPSRKRAFRFDVVFGKQGTMPTLVRIRHAGQGVWMESGAEEDRLWRPSFGTRNGAWRVDVPTTDYDRLDGSYAVAYTVIFHQRFLRRRLPDQEIEAELICLQGRESPDDHDWDQVEQLLFIFGERRLGRSETRPYASAPVRSKPRRTYDPARPTPDPEGDYVPMYLANLHFQNRNQWDTLRGALEEFGREAGLFDELTVKPLGARDSGPFQVQVRKFGGRAKGPQRNLIDVGYGVSQVLPVLTELLRRDAPPMFLLQQPEVHLHPSAQAALGSLFCEVARPDRQLLVETHSDHLLDRVRMDVRDGRTKLKPEDVSILFFERGDLDVRIHSLRFDHEGNVLDAPPSYRRFFMQETARSLWKQ